MKLNLGSGKKPLAGYVGIDAQPPADIISDVKKIALDNECAEEIIAIHVFEHLYFWETFGALQEWHRLLRPGGKLILEMPDVVKAARNLLEMLKADRMTDRAQQLSYWGLYGDPRYEDPLQTHKWGWTFITLKPLVEAAGYRDVVEKRTVYHKVGIDVRDFRLEAVK